VVSGVRRMNEGNACRPGEPLQCHEGKLFCRDHCSNIFLLHADNHPIMTKRIWAGRPAANVLLLQLMDGTDRWTDTQTDTRPLHRPCSAQYVSLNNRPYLSAEQTHFFILRALYFSIVLLTLGRRRGVVVSGVRRVNEVNARRARLLPGSVTVFGQVNHLCM